MQIYKAVIESRLLCSLGSLVLTCFDETRKTSHRRFPEQMFAFYFGNTYFLSRTSNAEVLQRSGHVSVSKLLERKPLLLLGKILRHPNHPLRQASFAPGTYTATSRYLRVGRPRKEWMIFFQHFLLQVVCTICCILSWNAVAPAGFEPMNRSGPVRLLCSVLQHNAFFACMWCAYCVGVAHAPRGAQLDRQKALGRLSAQCEAYRVTWLCLKMLGIFPMK